MKHCSIADHILLRVSKTCARAKCPCYGLGADISKSFSASSFCSNILKPVRGLLVVFRLLQIHLQKCFVHEVKNRKSISRSPNILVPLLDAREQQSQSKFQECGLLDKDASKGSALSSILQTSSIRVPTQQDSTLVFRCFEVYDEQMRLFLQGHSTLMLSSKTPIQETVALKIFTARKQRLKARRLSFYTYLSKAMRTVHAEPSWKLASCWKIQEAIWKLGIVGDRAAAQGLFL